MLRPPGYKLADALLSFCFAKAANFARATKAAEEPFDLAVDFAKSIANAADSLH